MTSAEQTAQRKRSSNRSNDPEVAGVTITHPDRVLYPKASVTKLNVARYYEEMQEEILPHLANRPLSLVRCPEGRENNCFYQKHPDKTLSTKVPRVTITEKSGGSDEYIYISSITDLVSLVQYGVLEFHPWGCQVADVEKPDTLIFDLDPGPNVPWRVVAETAFGLRDRLQGLGLTSFLQASGGKGLHLLVPIQPRWEWETIKGFAHGLSQAHAESDPTFLTTHLSKSKRRGKVFIDYLRNGRGNTTVAPYSTRARENATVATPLRWDELSPRRDSNRYTVTNIRRRVSALKAPPWEGYEAARATITQTMLEQYPAPEQ